MMNLNIELKKATVINRMCHRWLRRYPHAYVDMGRIGDIMYAYHNKKAEIINRIEDAVPHYVVKFNRDTYEAVVIDRQLYLADFDYYYDLYE